MSGGFTAKTALVARFNADLELLSKQYYRTVLAAARLRLLEKPIA